MSQRWRLTVARGPGAADLQHREVTPIWEGILAEVAGAAAADAGRPPGKEPGGAADDREAGRPRVVFAAPLPLGLTGDAELIDLVLPVGRIPRARLRAIVEPRLPADHRLVDAADVWIGEPSLPSLVDAAHYEVDVVGPEATAGAVRAATSALLARETVGRPGRDPRKGPADLRPLIAHLEVDESEEVSPPVDAIRLRMTLRVDAALGSGRPEEVVEVLGAFGPPLEIRRAHRVGFALREPPARKPRLTLSRPRPTLTRRTRTVSG